jgi:superfamily I DNA/RNA helicase
MNTEITETKKVVKKFTPSKYQKEIFKFITKDKKNGLISAVAGSGKTTTLIKALEIIPKDNSVLFLAFNKNISDELKKRVPLNKCIEVRTVHSFGYTILTSVVNPEINQNKYRLLYQDIITCLKTKDYSILKTKYSFDQINIGYFYEIKNLINDKNLFDITFKSDVLKLSNLGRLHYIDFNTFSVGVSELKFLSNVHSVITEDKQCEIAFYLTKMGMNYMDMIDYTDMIFLPNVLKLNVPKYDFVFIDECQDLNTCQRLLMQEAIKPETGRFIAVGDPKQAIYAFAGADAESYNKLREIPNTIELPLSETYRCSPEIVNMVKDINSEILPHPKNKKGKVIHDFSHLDIEDGDMVLCRNTFPLVSFCIHLLSKGKKSYIIGSDIGLSLINMINKCERKNEEFNMENVFARLHQEKENLIDKVMVNNSMNRQEALEQNNVILFNEKVDIIEGLSDEIDDPIIVIKKIENIFSDDNKQGISLSTIHKSKGLESERVFILHPELLPSKNAFLSWEIEQENNLKYVAYTRAKTTLGFINDYDAWENKKIKVVKKIANSKHVGTIGSKVFLELTITGVRTINTKYGETIIHDLVDSNGNILYKFGEIDKKYFNNRIVINKIGEKVSFYGIISAHETFNSENVTKIGKISQY